MQKKKKNQRTNKQKNKLLKRKDNLRKSQN